MTYADLVANIATQLDLKKTEVAAVIETLRSTIISTVKSGDDISIVGLGKFVPQTKKARTARNPKTGTTVSVPEKKTIKFKLASKVAEDLN